MSTKHTPGKWEICESGWFVISETAHICQMMGSRRDKEKKANARLIAAAPELLEALKRIRDGFDGYDITDWKAIVEENREVAANAIASAEGNEPEEHTGEPEIKPIATYKGFEIFDSGGGKLTAYEKNVDPHPRTVVAYNLHEIKKLIGYMVEDDEHTGEPDPSDLYREWKDAQDDADQPTAYDP